MQGAADLELAGVNHQGHVGDGKRGLGNVGGDHNLANAWRGHLKGLALLLGGHRGVQGDHPLAALPVGGMGGQLVAQSIYLTHACTSR